MTERTVHLICNAHLDPVWLWEWEEGAAEAISTFRVAADFCEEYPGFVFNHNEVILYEWVREYEPALFKRIQRLVAEGKWHIMGGWYLQPDCNMPSGESMARQALEGRRYFDEYFDARPTTAINFDPFGHAWGIAQILARSGYDSYVFCRPSPGQCKLPAETFTWEGPDGSRVAATRAFGSYLSLRGTARNKVERFLEDRADEIGYVLWGIGNHGGGPSREDVRMLGELASERDDARIVHSTPEAYFAEIRTSGAEPPVHRGDINLWAPGCYTSMAQVKQKHRTIENTYYATEKMLAAASTQGLLEYPKDELQEARRDLLSAEFHDVLPGSSIEPVEDAAVRGMDHGLEILSRLKARAFFALAAGQPVAKDGDIPILVFNPHPWDIDADIACEFNLPDQNREGTFTQVTATSGGRTLPTQVEIEHSFVPLDWRKRVVFRARLRAGVMNRFDCRLEVVRKKPAPKLRERNGRFRLKTADLEIVINARTGLLERFATGGRDLVKTRACLPVVMNDNMNPWGGGVSSFPDKVGAFRTMSKARAQAFSCSGKSGPGAVRVVEDGPVRAIVEALMEYGDSQLVMRYLIPKKGTELGVELRVFWGEKDRMLKLEIPTPFADARYVGQTVWAASELPIDGTEAVSQRWAAVVDDSSDTALTVLNDRIYGSDFRRGRLRLTLLRSPAYAALVGDADWGRPFPEDRYSPRMDQGERVFRFRLNGGKASDRLGAVEREAVAFSEEPLALSFFPSGQGEAPQPIATLSDKACVIPAIKQAEDSDDLVVRVFEPTGRARKTTLRIPALGVEQRLAMGAFEAKTLRIERKTGACREVNLLEE